MSRNFPTIRRERNSIEVAFTSEGGERESIPAEFVLDFNSVGEVIGIEILNLELLAGPEFLRIIDIVLAPSVISMKYSYDPESDAFYLRLADEPSINQRSVAGEILLNSEREIVAFRSGTAAVGS